MTGTRLPRVVWVLAAGTFMLGTSEFMIAGLLPEVALAMRVSVARAGLLTTVFAVGMIVGSPVMALATRRTENRRTLLAALAVFAGGHIIAAVSASFALLLAARFLTALATGAFWSVAAVVATRTAGPDASARALAVVMGGLTLANVIGVPAGAAVGHLVGWRGPFWALAVLAAAGAVAISRLVPAPVVLIGFGAGALAGTVLGGRFGDQRPFTTAITASLATTIVLLLLAVLSSNPTAAVGLVALMALTGFAVNPIRHIPRREIRGRRADPDLGAGGLLVQHRQRRWLCDRGCRARNRASPGRPGRFRDRHLRIDARAARRARPPRSEKGKSGCRRRGRRRTARAGVRRPRSRGAAWISHMSRARTRQELDRVGAADELEIAVCIRDGSLRRPVPLWVRHHGRLVLRMPAPRPVPLSVDVGGPAALQPQVAYRMY
jgi:MFS transporter, DHA1 family, inner membrane transport protein